VAIKKKKTETCAKYNGLPITMGGHNNVFDIIVSGKKWNHSIFASNFASAGQFLKSFHQQA